MKIQVYKETTIVSRGTRLRRLVNLNADLDNPESVKEIIALQKNWKESMKEVVVFAYDLYAKWREIKWQRPRYKAIRQLPYIPQEREIDDVIAGCNKEIALFLQIAKDTGARAGEIYRLQWTDIDFEGRTISIIAEKGSNPRIFRLSNKLFDMLSSRPKDTQNIFNRYLNLNNLRRTFERQRNRTAKKLGNSRLQKITFHTLRHWKGTMEYHNTKDILHVMQVLGHKNIKNTLLYTQLLQVEKDDQFICKVAKTPKEIQELIEQGFEFVCSSDDLKFFKKRK
jgi:integrase